MKNRNKETGGIKRRSGYEVIRSLMFTCVLMFTIAQSAWAIPGIQINNEDTDFATSNYQLDSVDMEVKVLGGSIKHRRFLDGVVWQFNPNWTNLQLEYDAEEPEHPAKIRRNRYYYEKSGAQTTPTYVFDERLSIVKTDTGYRWSDRAKGWIDYDESGYATSFGNEKGVTAYLIRDEDGLLQSVEDRNHTKVLTYTYDTNKLLDKVEDYSGRVVDYTFSKVRIGVVPKTNFRGAVLYARLDSVVDVRGKTWTYGYRENENILRSMTDPNGHVREIQYEERWRPAGGAVKPYVCVDWAGGNWAQVGISGVWSFQNYKCLKKVSQGGSSGEGSPGTATGKAGTIDPQYVPQGRLFKGISDEIGVIAKYSYRYNSRKKQYVTAITDGDNGLNALTYDEKGRLVNKIRNGRVVMEQVIEGNTRETYDENGNKTVYQRDKFRNPIKITYADNSFITRRWDVQTSNLLESTDENGNVTSYGYNNGLLTSLQYGFRSTVQQNYSLAYNSDNELETITEPAVDGVAAVTTFKYDSFGNVTQITDAEGHVTKLKDHDVLGNPRTVIDGRGNTWRYSYDNVGNLLSKTSPLGHVTEFSYDDAGNLETITDAEQSTLPEAQRKVTTLGYDARNRLVSITDPLSNVTQLAYNGRDMLTGITDALKHSVSFAYNLDGQLEISTDGNGNQITRDYGYLNLKKFKGLLNEVSYPTYSQSYSYDSRNRPTLVTEQAENAETRSIGYSYYNNGELKSITHPDQLTSKFDYDALNRLTDFTDAAGELTQLAYDDRNGLKQVSNAKNISLRRYGYDRLGNLTSEIFADDAGYSFVYDANGNLQRQTDAKGQVTRFDYDKDNRLTSLRYFVDTTAAQDDAKAQKTKRFSYDNNDRMVAWDDGQFSGTFKYDEVGRLLDWSVDYGAFTQFASYSYYANGLKKTFTGPDGVTVSYGYDNNNQLQTLTIPGQGTVSVNSFKWYAPETVTLPGGGEIKKTYDGYMRTSAISDSDKADKALLDYRYQYDNKDNITSINILAGQTTGETEYGYDAMGRLEHYQGPTTDGSIDLGYDPVGNRTSDSRSTANWQYDDRDRLISRDQLTYAYDANGSLTSITHATDGLQKRFVYNLENRLSEVWSGDDKLIAVYRYDPFGRRVVKTVGGLVTYFFYAPEGLVAEVGSAGSTITNYGYRPDNSGVKDAGVGNNFINLAAGQLTQARIDENSRWGTDPVYVHQDRQYGYYLTDHLGAPRQVIAMSGAILWSADYDVFGYATVNQQILTGNLRFPGQYYDQETGLHYNCYRYYDPTIGQYTTPDPIGLAGGLSTYAYAKANPVNFIDPDGKLFFLPAVIVAIGGGSAAPLIATATAVVFGAAAIMNAQNPNWIDDPRANQDWKDYKARYREPPPEGMDPCQRLKWQLKKERRLLRDRQAWDRNYRRGTHAEAIRQSKSAIRNLKKKIRRTCKRK